MCSKGRPYTSIKIHLLNFQRRYQRTRNRMQSNDARQNASQPASQPITHPEKAAPGMTSYTNLLGSNSMCSRRGRLSSWEDRTAVKAPYTCPPQFGTPRSPSPSSHPRSPPTRRHRRLLLLAKFASAAAAQADCRPSKTPTWCSPYSLAMRFRQWPSPNPVSLPCPLPPPAKRRPSPYAKPYPNSCASHIAGPLNSLLATSTTTATMGNSIQTLRPRMRHYCRSPRVPSSPACSSLRHRSSAATPTGNRWLAVQPASQ